MVYVVACLYDVDVLCIELRATLEEARQVVIDVLVKEWLNDGNPLPCEPTLDNWDAITDALCECAEYQWYIEERALP